MNQSQQEQDEPMLGGNNEDVRQMCDINISEPNHSYNPHFPIAINVGGSQEQTTQQPPQFLMEWDEPNGNLMHANKDPVKLKVRERENPIFSPPYLDQMQGQVQMQGQGSNQAQGPMQGKGPGQMQGERQLWPPAPPALPQNLRRRNYSTGRRVPFNQRISSRNQVPSTEVNNQALNVQDVEFGNTDMDLLESPRVLGARTGLRRLVHARDSFELAMNANTTPNPGDSINPPCYEAEMWGNDRSMGDFSPFQSQPVNPNNNNNNSNQNFNNSNTTNINGNNSMVNMFRRGGVQQVPRLNPPNLPSPFARNSSGGQPFESIRDHLSRSRRHKLRRPIPSGNHGQPANRFPQPSSGQNFPESLDQEMWDAEMCLLDDILFPRNGHMPPPPQPPQIPTPSPQQPHPDPNSWPSSNNNSGNSRRQDLQQQLQLQQIQQLEYMEEQQYLSQLFLRDMSRARGGREGGVRSGDFVQQQLANQHRVQSQVGERLSQMMDQINMLRVQMDTSDSRSQSRQRLLSMITQAMEDFGGPPDFGGLSVNSGEMREMVRRARQAGISPDLLFSDRDFDANDYEQLLRLDQFADHSHLGASSEQISSVQLINVEKQDIGQGGQLEGERCAICLEDFQVSDVLRKMPCVHCFHKDCLDKWLEHKAVCPNCGKDFRQDEKQKDEQVEML